MGRNYPEQPLDITSSWLRTIMMKANDTIDGNVWREYGDSLSIDREGPDGFIKPDRYQISIKTTIQLKRPSVMQVVFDGVYNHG